MCERALRARNQTPASLDWPGSCVTRRIEAVEPVPRAPFRALIERGKKKRPRGVLESVRVTSRSFAAMQMTGLVAVINSQLPGIGSRVYVRRRESKSGGGLIGVFDRCDVIVSVWRTGVDYPGSRAASLAISLPAINFHSDAELDDVPAGEEDISTDLNR